MFTGKGCAGLTGIHHTASPELRATRFTAPGKSCRYKDPSLRSREGILPHRYIYRANTDSPPDGVSPEQGSRTDNLPLPPLSTAQAWAEAKMRPPVVVLAGQVH